ncbi:hypothetical protein V9L16_00195 [Pseudomonas tolaasii]|uniref:hypothetical protein n=1 Tax=Pseudomonas tolaasii TaxID=29442 RepID=UPI0030CEAA25
MEVHAAKASAERAALVPLKITPAPNAQVFGYTIPIMAGDLERVISRTDEPIDAEVREDRQNVRRIQREPLTRATQMREMPMNLLLQSHAIIRANPPQK